jgi:glucose-1-phosphate thymidylyltransferase
VLEDLVSSGVKKVAIVLGETFPELVKEYYGDGSSFGARIIYIYQGKPLGIAHAVKLCRDFVGEDIVNDINFCSCFHLLHGRWYYRLTLTS